ncbi:MAG: L,D-transpeptidase family protein [Bacteriovoracaceae bacterium]|nr:L,D-transpeptidase family protein [Bacteriovoracaceae bacterium]
MKQFLILLLVVFSTRTLAQAQEYLPQNIIQLDDKFSHHIALVEKSSHTLYLYQNNNGTPQLLKQYKVATGKFTGNKASEGDHKTPEGIYLLERFLSAQELVGMYGEEKSKMYGAGAFTTNYPNVIDERLGKGGSGIWLHSTDDNTRINKGLDSRGCVVVVDEDLKDISKYIDLANTSMVIVQNINFQQKKTWESVKNNIMGVVANWQESWKNKNFDSYIGHYHPEKFHDSKGNFHAYKHYKKAVFSNPGTPVINFNHVSVLVQNDYAVVQMEQDYRSTNINDIGKKILYLQQDQNYNWKIVAEQWRKLDGESRNLAFVPAMRFFKN